MCLRSGSDPMAAKKLTQQDKRNKFYDNLQFMRELYTDPELKARKYVLGLDPSLTRSAVAVVKMGKKRYRLSHSPAAARNKEGMARGLCYRMEATVNWLLDEMVKYDLRLITIEGYLHGKTSSTTLGEVGGILRYNCFWGSGVEGAPVVVVSNSQVKKYLLGGKGGDGAPGKNAIIKAVYKHLSVDTNNDNEADAAVIAKVGLDLMKYVKKYSNDVPAPDDNKGLLEYVKKPPEQWKIPQHRWEVLVKIITEQCGPRVLHFYKPAQTL